MERFDTEGAAELERGAAEAERRADEFAPAELEGDAAGERFARAAAADARADAAPVADATSAEFPPADELPEPLPVPAMPAPRAAALGRSEARASWAVGALGVAVLVATLAPLVLISAYNHSYADDWHYGVWAHLTLRETGNVFAALVTALEQVGKAWFDWQGSYSAIFLMAIEPSVFGEQCYVIAAPLILASLIAGTLFFTHVLMVELLGCRRGHWLGLSCLMVAVQLLLQPSPVEGVFWYNSAVYYTTYHAAALAMFGCVAKIADPARVTRPRGAIVAASLLAVFVAGGNFVTALVAAEVMLVVMVVLIARARRCSTDMLWPFGLLVIGLAVSLAAPGNSVRQQTQFPDDSAGVVGTIWHSSLSAFQYIQQWSCGMVVLLALFAAVIAVHACGRAVERGWRFPAPLAVLAGSVALFATSFTPTFWAEGSVGPGRVQNCRFDLFVVLVVLNVFWLVGWVAARRRQIDRQPAAQVLTLRHVAWACSLITLVFCCVVGSMAADEDLGEDLSSVSAARSLASGAAAAYDAQVWDRLETIENSSEQSLRVPYYTNVPHVLLMGDIRDNMDNYINYRLCQWYGKESIVGYRAASNNGAASGSAE